jgi:hypothetical protein
MKNISQASISFTKKVANKNLELNRLRSLHYLTVVGLLYQLYCLTIVN